MGDGSRATLISDVRVFDGVRVRPRASVMLRDGLITELRDDGTAPRVPPDAEIIDGADGTLLPGLIDAHTHVQASSPSQPGSLEQALVFGVTTELDMFADPRIAAAQRARAVAEDGLADLRSAGTCATVAGGHPTQLVDRGFYPPFPTVAGPDEAEAFVADRVAEGSDHIKIILDDGHTVGMPVPTLGTDTLRALVDAAHRHDRLAVVHVMDRDATLRAVAAGADGLAHLPVDPARDPDLGAALAAAGMFAISTLAVDEAVCGHGHGPQVVTDPRFAPHLDDTSRMMLTLLGGNFPLGPHAQVDADAPAAAVRELLAAGVPILAGTDAGTLGVAHGASLHRELELLVAAGMSPTAALTAATAAPADRFGLTDRGRIVPGLSADLLLVHGDPTTDITTTANIHAVWRRGTRAR